MRLRKPQSGLIIEGGEMINSKEVKEYAKKCGADLIGIASIERFKDVPAQHNPSSIFPEAKSIIVIGRRITRGTLRGVEEGTQFDLYSLYGDVWLQDRFLAMTTFKIAEFLEDNRYEAVPLPNLPPQVPPMGIAVRPDQPPPNVMVDFDDAAMRAGLGEIGYCGILLTPEFGPRQRFQIILTDAKLEPNPLLKQKICDRCMECIKNCPLDAIDSTKEKEINICGKKMLVAEIDYAKCTTCKNGASPNRYHPAGNPDRLAAICVRSCIDHLEKTNKLKNKFSSPFRKRTPWKIGKREMDFYKI
ncbi:MAG: hypothetical protein COW28_06920 [bacterium (Candidatus Ratteibacteria) CG15_BIG_FIL_POST_REV_8_21_14_020_41_12]|uniref:4Fe-4S ferredoxin-type domain-containing protein n=1 Tax=bacterium (Candidatus Ratteibacteria) CG15_BIG_FIL_POST_REV_8_21_14_020_41_12 TaxID=2014291 RepID=A0A2M7GWA7_9BACT|nr:MAG: hypothetical protein COW28_06920 [bacterium (Candidatus Ratteibacteria) CG15_BIG_FIL_POST_REV_8_21_14_020_41_12]